jgi:hypothetical protein
MENFAEIEDVFKGYVKNYDDDDDNTRVRMDQITIPSTSSNDIL